MPPIPAVLLQLFYPTPDLLLLFPVLFQFQEEILEGFVPGQELGMFFAAEDVEGLSDDDVF